MAPNNGPAYAKLKNDMPAESSNYMQRPIAVSSLPSFHSSVRPEFCRLSKFAGHSRWHKTVKTTHFTKFYPLLLRIRVYNQIHFDNSIPHFHNLT